MDKSNRSPRRLSIVASLVAFPLLLAMWTLASFVLSFYAGATFGGYGAAAQGPTAGWYTPVVIVLALLGLLADLATGRVVYHLRHRRPER